MAKWKVKKPTGKLMKDVKGKPLTWETKKSAKRYLNRNFKKGYKGKPTK